MEFENDQKYRQAFIDAGFPPGRMISGSKSGYVRNNPNSRPVFNARICILGEGIVWWGDLDITRDREELEKIAISIEKNLYILRESSAWSEVTDEDIIKWVVEKI